MMPTRRQVVVSVSAAAALPKPVLAQGGESYPARPVTVVVPQAVGGTADIVARLVADQLGHGLGQRFVVDNRVGGGGNVGTASAARAAPDGYTLLVGSSSSHSINPVLYRKVAFDPVADFEPVTLLATMPLLLVAHPSLPANSVAELVAISKQRPAELQYASAGVGTLNHLLGELLRIRAGIRLTHVPYRGVAPAMNDIIAGHVPLGFASLPSALPQVQAGNLRAIGITSRRRAPTLPDVPAIGETLPGFEAEIWVALFAVKGTAPDILAKLRDRAVQAIETADMKAKLRAQGAEAAVSTPDALETLVKSELAKWAAVVKESGAQVEE